MGPSYAPCPSTCHFTMLPEGQCCDAALTLSSPSRSPAKLLNRCPSLIRSILASTSCSQASSCLWFGFHVVLTATPSLDRSADRWCTLLLSLENCRPISCLLSPLHCSDKKGSWTDRMTGRVRGVGRVGRWVSHVASYGPLAECVCSKVAREHVELWVVASQIVNSNVFVPRGRLSYSGTDFPFLCGSLRHGPERFLRLITDPENRVLRNRRRRVCFSHRVLETESNSPRKSFV